MKHLIEFNISYMYIGRFFAPHKCRKKWLSPSVFNNIRIRLITFGTGYVPYISVLASRLVGAWPMTSCNCSKYVTGTVGVPTDLFLKKPPKYIGCNSFICVAPVLQLRHGIWQKIRPGYLDRYLYYLI